MGGDGQALTNKRTLLERHKLYDVQSGEEPQHGDAAREAIRRRVEQWTNCAMALTPLESPLAFGLDGHIFSMQSVLEYLQARHECSGEVRFGIRKLSDVCEVSEACEAEDGCVVCPVTHYSTTSGAHAFVGMWKCGHVVAASTVASKADEVSCPYCGVDSLAVPLAPISTAAAEQQQARLRSCLRKQRKRRRDGGDG